MLLKKMSIILRLKILKIKYPILLIWLVLLAIKNGVVKKHVYNPKIKNTEDKIPDIINLSANATCNAKINEVKNEIPCISSLLLLLLMLK